MEEKIDRRKIKPRCDACGELHWRFVKCESADTQNAAEAVANAKRERAKVYPVWRNNDGVLNADRRTSWNTTYKR